MNQRIYKTENSLKVMWNRARLQDIHQYDKIQVRNHCGSGDEYDDFYIMMITVMIN